LEEGRGGKRGGEEREGEGERRVCYAMRVKRKEESGRN
jgi:hypothetical protein